jgi:transposase-like protein
MNFQSSGRWRSQRASRTSPAISSPSCALVRFEAILRKLARRGLRGVKLVVSDAHEGIKATVGKVLNATWQRCRVHYAEFRIMPTSVAKPAWEAVIAVKDAAESRLASF